MWRVLLALGAIAIWGSAHAADPLTPPAFTAVVARAVSAALPSAKVTVTGELQIKMRSATGNTTTTDLRNAYRLYVLEPQSLNKLIERYVGVLAETSRLGDANAVLDRSRIIPILKPRQWVEGMQQALLQNKASSALEVAQNRTASPVQVLSEPFNDELSVVYVEDRPVSLRFLTTRDDVGDRVKLPELALANLRRLLTKVEMAGGEDGIFIADTGGNYEASLLLSNRLWSSGQIKVDGEIVVAVPIKEALFVTGSQNQKGIARLRALAAELATGPYALTTALFVYRDGKFVRFEE